MTGTVRKIEAPKKKEGKVLSIFMNGKKPFAVEKRDLDATDVDKKVEKGVKLAPIMIAVRRDKGVVTDKLKESLAKEHGVSRVIVMSSKLHK